MAWVAAVRQRSWKLTRRRPVGMSRTAEFRSGRQREREWGDEETGITSGDADDGPRGGDPGVRLRSRAGGTTMEEFVCFRSTPNEMKLDTGKVIATPSGNVNIVCRANRSSRRPAPNKGGPGGAMRARPGTRRGERCRPGQTPVEARDEFPRPPTGDTLSSRCTAQLSAPHLPRGSTAGPPGSWEKEGGGKR